MFTSQEGCPVRRRIFALKTHQPAFWGNVGCAEWVSAPLHPVWNPNSASLPAFLNVSATQGQSFLEEIIPFPPLAAQDISTWLLSMALLHLPFLSLRKYTPVWRLFLGSLRSSLGTDVSLANWSPGDEQSSGILCPLQGCGCVCVLFSITKQ